MTDIDIFLEKIRLNLNPRFTINYQESYKHEVYNKDGSSLIDGEEVIRVDIVYHNDKYNMAIVFNIKDIKTKNYIKSVIDNINQAYSELLEAPK